MIRLWTRLGRPHGRLLALALLLAGLSGGMSVFLLGLSGWFLTASAIAGAAGLGLSFNHLYPSAGVRGSAMGRIASRYAEQLIGHDATLRLSSKLRASLFRAEARNRSGLGRPDAEALSIFLDDIKAAEAGFLRLLLPAAAALTGALVASVFAILTAPVLVIPVLAGVFMAVLLSGWARLGLQVRAGRSLRDAETQFRSHVGVLVEHRIELEALGRFGERCTTLVDQSGRLDELSARAEARPVWLSTTGALLGGLSALLAVWVGYRLGGSPAMLTGLALSIIAAHQGVAVFTQALIAYPRTRLAFDRIEARVSAPAAVREPKAAEAAPVSTVLPVEVHDLEIGTGDHRSLVSPVSLRLAPASVTEIVGPSGIGKSVLLETLGRLRDPVCGDMHFGGQSYDQLRSAGIRQRVGHAPQLPDFLGGRLRDEFLLVRPDMTEEDMLEACRLALFSGVVGRDPDGLDQAIEPGGSNLSGGEARRLGVARALVGKPELLLLDEPFAGLHRDLRAQLARNLGEWAVENGSSLIVVTHEPDEALWPGLDYQRLHLQSKL